MMNELEIRLLGQFKILVRGRNVVLPSRPAQSLLAFLVLNPERPHRREVLAGRFWPDSTESDARGSLRVTLYQIRNLLGEGIQVDRYLVVDQYSVTFLSGDGCLVDVHELERADAADGDVESLMAVVSHYVGDLLPGFYEDWVANEQVRLRAVLDRTMKRLLHDCAAAGRWDCVVKWAEWWIALGDAPEFCYRALMVAKAALGDRGGVAIAYRRCWQMLDRLVGVQPSDMTQMTFQSLIGTRSAPQFGGTSLRSPFDAPTLALFHALASGRYLNNVSASDQRLARC